MLPESFFDGLASPALDTLAQTARRRVFQSGEILFRRGDAPREIFGLLNGRVKVWRTDRDGTALTLFLVGRGDLVGALAVAQGTPYPVTATAFEPTECEVWAAERFLAVLKADPIVAARMLRLVANQAEQILDRLEEINSVPLEQRLARVLLRLAGYCGRDRPADAVSLKVSRQDLSELVSVTLPTVSRVMSRWRRTGLIGGGRGEVEIRSLSRMTELADLAPDIRRR